MVTRYFHEVDPQGPSVSPSYISSQAKCVVTLKDTSNFPGASITVTFILCGTFVVLSRCSWRHFLPGHSMEALRVHCLSQIALCTSAISQAAQQSTLYITCKIVIICVFFRSVSLAISSTQVVNAIDENKQTIKLKCSFIHISCFRMYLTVYM